MFVERRVVGLLNTNQAAIANIEIPKTNSIQKTVALALGGKIIFNHIAPNSAPRSVSSNARLSSNDKKLTTNLKIEHLTIAKLDNKKLKFLVVSIQLEGNKEKVLIDTGASTSFVAI